ncbi:MAG: helix-turn-helix domain-containing protein [Haloarculaceae archaeon]
MVVFEFAVPSETLVLDDALEAFPDVVVEYERVVPTQHNPMPFVWATNGHQSGFTEAVAADPNVERIHRTTEFEDGALYRIEWETTDSDLLRWCANNRDDTAVLEAQGQDGEWSMKIRFPGRGRLSEFRTYCDEHGIDMRVVRVYDLAQPKIGQYNITAKQRDALLRALEMGHFEIPRAATLEEVADSLGISARSVSERLRRGQTNLISNSLTIGRPADIGLDDEAE